MHTTASIVILLSLLRALTTTKADLIIENMAVALQNGVDAVHAVVEVQTCRRVEA